MMEKTFDPASVEGRIGQLWEKEGAFRAGRAERAQAEPYTIVIPPPNVTGVLHMGHVLNNTIQDILSRKARISSTMPSKDTAAAYLNATNPRA